MKHATSRAGRHMERRPLPEAAAGGGPVMTEPGGFDGELARIERSLYAMAEVATRMLEDAGRALETADPMLARHVLLADDRVDAACLDLEHAVVDTIAMVQPDGADLRRLLALQQVSLHLERIADGAVDISRAVERAGAVVDADVVAELAALETDLVTMLELALLALEQRNTELCLELIGMDRRMHRVHETLFLRLAASAADPRTYDWALQMDRVSRLLERVGGHAVDIAETAWFLITGELRLFDRSR